MATSISSIFGKRYGRLVVLSFDKLNAYGGRYYQCLCDCGARKSVYYGSLSRGATKSCGCLNREVARDPESKTTHGLSHTKEYQTWINMKHRCEDRRNVKYADYGGRGISVCERWGHFEYFLDDMGNAPTPGHSLDRVNNALGYGPQNCRWATRKEQSLNKRNTRMLTVDGVTRPLAEWCEKYGVPSAKVRLRLDRYGFTPEQAVKTIGRRKWKHIKEAQ